MSIVEQAVDTIKNEERIKGISTSHDDVIKVVTKEMPVEMDIDTMETTKAEKQTNGSASALKDIVDDKKGAKNDSESAKKPAEVVAEPEVEQMDVDIPTNGNGNGVKEEEETETVEDSKKETDDISGEGKTGTVAEADKKSDTKDDTDEKKDEVKKTEDKLESSGDKKEEVKPEATASEVDVKKTEGETEKSSDDVEMSEAKEEEKVEAASADDVKSEVGKDPVEEETKEDVEKENNAETTSKSEKDAEDVEMNDSESTKDFKDKDKETSDGNKENSINSVENNKNDEAKVKINSNDIKETSDIEKPVENKENTEESSDNKVPSENLEEKGQEKIDEKTKSTEDEEMNGVKETEQKDSDEQKDATDSVIPADKCATSNSEEHKEKPSEKEEPKEVPNSEEASKEVKVVDEANENEKHIEIPQKEDTSKTTANGSIENSVEEKIPDDKGENCTSEEKKCDKEKESSNEVKEDTTSATNDDQEQPSEGDQEMAEAKPDDEVPAKDEQITDEDPVSQTMYVDENTHFDSGKIVELSRMSWSSTREKQQYVRGCLWSPDGTCILTAVNLDGMHVINLATELYSKESVSFDRPLDQLESVIHVKEGGTVYDYSWYPFMNSTMPETCCWISSRQHCPIQLWDGFTGDLRGSYRGYDNVDEVEAAFSVTFTSDAEKIIGGYKKTLKIFDTKSPGREYSVIPIKQPCSCFAVSETQSNIIATGSWNSAINLYDLRTPKLGSLVTLEEHSGGVTFLKFTANGDSLFSGARKDNKLLEWDMRNFSKPIRRLQRTVKTNQRIYFDLSPGEKWLVSGDTDGLVRIWDLKSESDTEDFTFGLHEDCCNGVSFHPSRPMLATCSGQYHFPKDADGCEPNKQEQIYENSLVFWWIGKSSDGNEEGTVENPVPSKEKGGEADTDEKMEA
ncbi:unnamed protein product [Hermetia illucens]|uniref:WD repeat-containing protein 79 n=1 Tax=Hermetia illucens TaxID=343691 RepID=A0A7R8UUP5_HERIL|nr:unnamed protein product [Hermetia illucens]